ncbi:amino acid ABC transporter permease [Ahrensia sp. R2A130]|uniref:amino acid ABC transporter permease n=1 Tax=Ahrensia sp. R2A130 TaxID=744979 RepID=UPI0001E0F832|nr:amino acid ABC transporter permease [Ahrensia sp. R2A130]EFL90474.1 glutamate/glutamine/aspartate/asparagine transport system permease protein BztC [Ahrensia sp. R2A130]
MSDTHAETVRYVATHELPALPAPVNTRGPAAWARANFFSTPRDTILSIIVGGLIAIGLWKLLPWLVFDSVFVAGSLNECREIDSGACFAVVTSRFNQLIFGFYPPELFWRPILAFVLMLVAFAPVLHDNLPRKMLWFSAVFPLLAYWLIWGGTIWGPLMIIAMIALAFVAFKAVAKSVNPVVGLLAAVAVGILWMLFLHDPIVSALSSAVNVGLEPVESSKLGGFQITFIIGVTGIVASLPIGILLALGRGSDMPTLKMICVGFIEFIRGVPLITLLFVASTLLNYFLPPGTNFDIVLRVIIMVTLFASAYMAEVIRGGLAALPKGQYEAADALGLNYWQATRLIILPQALKISIPGIVNTFIGLFKDTVLVSIIGILDPIGIMQPIRSSAEWNGIIWELPIFVGLVFFIFCFLMSRYSMYFERKLDTGHRN